MENQNEESLAEIEELKKRVNTMEAMIIQLFRLYNELAINYSQEKNQ